MRRIFQRRWVCFNLCPKDSRAAVQSSNFKNHFLNDLVPPLCRWAELITGSVRGPSARIWVETKSVLHRYLPSLEGDMILVVSCAWPLVVAWLLARAIMQRNSFNAIGRAPPPPVEIAPGIFVVVPARNEAANIGTCLLSLTNQTVLSTASQGDRCRRSFGRLHRRNRSFDGSGQT